ncbi:MAG: hypothetical protein F4213_03155 [Boseongicola sp. SB0677_bin_26]|nr:hypothetical protein [Boseongicola sp. SB0665_bin_10]MYG25012.1 hypothetical protein [Boseongicola sp. SB0677_bin_26]
MTLARQCDDQVLHKAGDGTANGCRDVQASATGNHFAFSCAPHMVGRRCGKLTGDRMPRPKRPIEERLAVARTRRDAAEAKVQALQAEMDAFEQAAFAALGRAVVTAETDAGNNDFVLLRYLPAIKSDLHREWLEGQLRPTVYSAREPGEAEPRSLEGAQETGAGNATAIADGNGAGEREAVGKQELAPEAADPPSPLDALGDKIVPMASPFPDLELSAEESSGMYELLRAVEKANG